ncbi:MAG: ABC transporter ATP-binding protein [Nitratiruptor sp.]|nr:ABC transporter ATP-binding protein [Nitratiruptor sp.]NPA84323.1 ATP-binding cassette domain-containing protein [Campylobacterota bacterium]
MMRKLFSLLSRRDKEYLALLLLFSIFISLIETIGVGIIMPFISLASDFGYVEQNPYLKRVYEFFGFTSPFDFAVAFGLFLVLFYIFRALMNYLYFYLLARFAQSRYHLLAYRLFENYMGLSYKDFIERNSSELTKTIINEANNLVQLISSALFLVSEIFVVLFIYSFLLYVNWKMTLLLTLFLALNIALLRWSVTRKIEAAGQERERHQRSFYKILGAAFGNFKMIKLRGTEERILEEFKEASFGFAKANIKNASLAHVPRLFLEAMGFSLIAIIVVYLLLKYHQDISAALPLLMAFILGLYRLMPSINRIISAYNEIVFRKEALEIVHNDLIYEAEDLGSEEVDFQEKIELQDITFGYLPDKPILKGVNLTIHKGEKVGIVGESGSGKSTLIDLIIGLYRPQSGKILVDGVALKEENIRSWRKKIGYIPQTIYLFDGTVAENVAFGEPIDEERIKEALRQANILDFLERHHEGIHTRVGEGGVKLSGGQRQRIAIARALYTDPEILVLDEATSALDNETEAKIMEEIYRLGAGKTLIIVAHRVSTLGGCGRVVKVEDGKITLYSPHSNLQ